MPCRNRNSLVALLVSLAFGVSPAARAADPIVIDAPEQSHLSPTAPDGDLPPLPGVVNVQIHRAAAPGYTYNHHVDLAAWHGRLYCGWNSTLKDEDTGPSRQLLSTSSDATHWSPPRDLFPADLAIPLRMYFYLAGNHHMLAIAGIRTSRGPLVERDKHGLLVREILADHTLAPVYTLQQPMGSVPAATPPPAYTTSPEPAFVAACEDLLSNTNFLLQEDYGVLLPPERRMKWNDPQNWPADLRNDARLYGKATAFFHRKDGTLVAVSKRGWTTTSADGGHTWQRPVIPSTLVTGMAKVWPQRVAEGQYALVYNPQPINRFPLILVSSEHGVTFSRMRVIHPALPSMRYPGLNKVPGPQYVRGLSEFSDDHSFPDRSMFVAYSVNKEDIWLARIPTPVRPDPADFDGPWNLYSPRWAPVTLDHDTLRLEDSDPADRAIATKVFPPAQRVRVSFDLLPTDPPAGSLHVNLLPPAGSGHPFRVTVGVPKVPCHYTIEADCRTQTYTYTVGHNAPTTGRFAEKVYSLGRLTFETENDREVAPDTDPKTVFEIRGIAVTPN